MFELMKPAFFAELVDTAAAGRVLESRGPRLHDWWTKSPPPPDPCAPAEFDPDDWGSGTVIGMDLAKLDADQTAVAIINGLPISPVDKCQCEYCKAIGQVMTLDMRKQAKVELKHWYDERTAAAQIKGMMERAQADMYKITGVPVALLREKDQLSQRKQMLRERQRSEEEIVRKKELMMLEEIVETEKLKANSPWRDLLNQALAEAKSLEGARLRFAEGAPDGWK